MNLKNRRQRKKWEKRLTEANEDDKRRKDKIKFQRIKAPH